MQQTQESAAENIMRRVRALLAFADEGSGATPAEAASAAAKAAQLMLRYNLSEAHVRARKGEKAEYLCERFTFAPTNGPYIVALRILANAIATSNFCRLLHSNRTGQGYIIGERANIDISTEMYARLNLQLARMAERAWLQEGKTSYPWLEGARLAGRSISWKRNYLLGAASTISQRLRQEREAAQQSQQTAERGNAGQSQGSADPQGQLLSGATEGAQITALVLVKDAELDAETKRRFPRTKAGKAVSVSGRASEAYFSGMRDGATVSLRNQQRIGD
jgi:hypothetical protein